MDVYAIRGKNVISYMTSERYLIISEDAVNNKTVDFD